MLHLAVNMFDFPWNLIPFVGLLLVVMAVMGRLRRRQQQPPRSASAAEQLEQHRQARGLQGDLEQVMVEVEQLARRFSAQLDAKSRRLEKLLEEADAKIERLERLHNRDDPDLRLAPPPAEPQDEAPTARSAKEDELAANVYRLADAGNDPIEIARALGEHVGTVELIIALRQANGEGS